jgi:D-alanyl-D-alanine carboxypeptidase (penicillin-binding protein 5/6)
LVTAKDSAVAMAEAISGTVDAFVNKMNERAKELGCTNTSFANVHGLDDPNHYTTAHDMALIARELLKHESILEYSSTYEAYLEKPDGTSTWMVNTNKLIKYYNGLDGLKTGYTSNAGYCLTATAKRNGMRLISVLMNEPTSQVRNSETIDLLNYGFTNYKIKTILSTNNDLGYIEVLNGKKKTVNLKLVEDATNLESLDEEKNYTYNIKVDKIKAPVKVGDIVGYLEIISGGVVLKTVDITVSENVEKANIWDLYKRNLNLFLSGI